MKKFYSLVAIMAVILAIAACKKEDDTLPQDIGNESLAE